MSTRNTVYDRRFVRGYFEGHKVIIPHKRLLDVYITTLVEWSEHSNDVRSDVKRWLVDKGPWRQKYGAFYFSREDAAAQFRLKFC